METKIEPPKHQGTKASSNLGVFVPWWFKVIPLFLFASFASPISARPLEQVKESGAIVLCAHPERPAVLGEGRRRGTVSRSKPRRRWRRRWASGLDTHWTVSAHDLNRADCDFVLDAIADPEAQHESRLKLSKPYGSSGVVLAVRGDNGRIRAFADLAAAGKIGILPGSMAAMYLGQHGVHTSPAGFEADLLDEVAAGELAGAAVTPTAIGYYNAQHAGRPMKAVAVFATVQRPQLEPRRRRREARRGVARRGQRGAGQIDRGRHHQDDLCALRR